MFPDAPECTVLAVHHNEQKSSEKKSEYAPRETLIPFGHCRLLPNLSISVRRSAGK